MSEAIKVEHLAYRYPGVDDTPGVAVFEDLSLSVEAGSFVAVLGGNGCGKSTLAKHFNSILLPCGGKVWVCGLDTADEEKLIAIRRSVGMVFQNPDNQIVANVVEEDVAFGPENLGISSAEIRRRVDKALKQVGMYEYREHAPHLLSGGQKQRIAIARAIIRQSPIIVLDEATASVDVQTEKKIQKAIQNLAGQRTIIAIAHRLSTIRDADMILVFHEGEIAERGTHEELLQKQGLYYNMHQAQAFASE